MKVSKRKLSIVKKTALGVVTFAVLIFIFTLYFSRSSSDLAREELEAIRAEDSTYAYTLTSKGFQEHVSLSDFQAYINQHPILKDYTDLSFTDRKTENGVNYLHGKVVGADGSQQQIDFELVKEGNDWKVQNMQLSTP